MKRRNDIIKRGKKVLELFDENKRFVPYIKTTTDLCDDIFSKTKIGSGSQGKIYKIKFRNDRKTYIMKKTYLNLYFITEDDVDKIIKYISKKTKDVSKLTMKQFIMFIMNYYDFQDRISWRKIMKFNHLSKNLIPNYNILDEFFLPVEDIDCRINRSDNYDNNLDFDGKIKVNKDDYVCFSDIFVETMISLIMSKLARDEVCYHFIIFYASIFCDDSFEYFIEKMDISLIDMIFDTDIDVNTIFDISNLFSIIISIFIMVDKYNICHNDLAFRNILIKKSKDDYTTIRYIINNIIFEFPFPKYLYKISDFGYAQKFSHPMILDYETLTLSNAFIPNFNTYGVFDMFKFFHDIISYIYKDLNNETKKYIDPFLKLLFGSKEEAIDIILENDSDQISIDIIKDVLSNSKLVLDMNLIIKVFDKYIVKTPAKNNVFIAVNYNIHSSSF
jgi:hypothetical protein